MKKLVMKEKLIYMIQILCKVLKLLTKNHQVQLYEVIFFDIISYEIRGEKMEKLTYIYLIRHSEQLRMKNKVINDENTQITNEKIILSVNGEKKAEELSKLEELTNIDVLWSSNYVRAISTAKYIANKNNIEINIDKNLNERKLRRLRNIRNIRKKC